MYICVILFVLKSRVFGNDVSFKFYFEVNDSWSNGSKRVD